MEFVLPLNFNEQDLISACVRQERWAQKMLYEEHYALLMRVCLRYARDEGEAFDLLHDGFLKILGNIHKYQVGTSLVAWMRRIIVNTCIDHYRRELRRRTEDLDQAFDLSNEEADAISKMSEQEILASVQSLSPVYRLVFNMYVVEGYSHREISEQLGITESTSRSNLVKARLKLKQLLTEKQVSHGF